ncbi:hypothetical protein TrCOL_g9903 [Triparma columacea]|uniref:HTH TFE/IIEalpha-type domain-containing protein n=1 Tax=Triparma columacea TaxID=722753 RepID=A0A9W7G5G8_9STRA|nr:hypothetical protein TrCOL_g9903 [Triparma columacea]
MPKRPTKRQVAAVPGVCTLDVDMTLLAESLIRNVARAFYGDSEVFLVDVLLRDKYLRDDSDLASRLKLPTQNIRGILTMLNQEGLVEREKVDDLDEGGSRSTDYWYIDLWRATKVIALRTHLMIRKIKDREARARGTGQYECPNYSLGMCNGLYGNLEAQNCVDPISKMFVCAICKQRNDGELEPDDVKSYTLFVKDDKERVKEAVDDLKRVQMECTEETEGRGKAKVELKQGGMLGQVDKGEDGWTTNYGGAPGGGLIRGGIMELLQKVRSSSRTLSSNYPSDNYALGRGAKRIEGTGKTATALAKRLKKEGEEEEEGAKVYKESDTSLLYVRGAGGAESKLKVQGGGQDAAMAAIRNLRGESGGGTAVDAHEENWERERLGRVREMERLEKEGRKKRKVDGGMEWLVDEGIRGEGERDPRLRRGEGEEKGEEEEEEDRRKEVLEERDEEQRRYKEAYELELERQKKLLLGSDSSSSEEEDSEEEGEGEELEEENKEKTKMQVEAGAGADAEEEESDDDVNWEDA